MRILISLVVYDLGGSERRYFNLACELSQRENVSVTLLVSSTVYERLLAMRDVPDELEVIELFKDGWRRRLCEIPSLKTPWRIVNKIGNASFYRLRNWVLRASSRKLDLKQYDVWHSVGAGARPCLPKMVTPNCVLSAADNEICLPGHAMWQRTYANAVRDGALVEVLTPGIAKDMKEFMGWGANEGHNLRVAPCSFSDHASIPVGVPKKNVVAFLGRFHRQKNPVIFVDAIAKICHEFPDFEFWMMGYGPLEGELSQSLVKNGIEDRVKVWREDNPVAQLAKAKVFVSIQSNDNYPSQALMEAMSAECAIVASNTGDTHLMVPQNAGVLAELNADSIAEALRGLLTDEQKVIEMGKNASQFIRSEFTVERYADYLLGVYSDVMKKSTVT